jgi:signal transduction histidine kinase
MIIAGRNRGRIDPTSAALEPVALRAAILRGPLPVALPRPAFPATVLVVALALLASVFAPWGHLELRAVEHHLAVENAIRLLATLGAVLFLHRFWRLPLARDLVFAGGFAIVAASDLAAGALFACACIEWSLEERRAAVRTVARERRRMAADVHDLIMQDLSFALANARTLTDDPARAGSSASTVVSAGERALAGARDMLNGLSERDTRPIAQAVEASVRAAARHTPLAFDAERVPSSARLDQPTHDALVHIAREAVTNAVKHARPNAIEVVLEHAGQWRLTVRDDGRGFEGAAGAAPATTPNVGDGFGLSSMRHSAHAVGGAVHVGSIAGVGTTVEAILP